MEIQVSFGNGLERKEEEKEKEREREQERQTEGGERGREWGGAKATHLPALTYAETGPASESGRGSMRGPRAFPLSSTGRCFAKPDFRSGVRFAQG